LGKDDDDDDILHSVSGIGNDDEDDEEEEEEEEGTFVRSGDSRSSLDGSDSVSRMWGRLFAEALLLGPFRTSDGATATCTIQMTTSDRPSAIS